MANLAQVLDPASSNGKKIVEIFDKLGVAMYDTNGQLKSGYDLLRGLYNQWGDLDGNTQKYIATTIAGTTQLNNFLALMNNFGHAVDATNTALDSQGSAMRENSAFMESIQAKLSQLQSTFQDFANNVIGSDLVKSVLDIANALLQLANTDIGQVVTQMLLLTSLGWGATSLVHALDVFKVAASQFANFGVVLKNIKFIASGAQGPLMAVGSAASFSLPIVLGLAAALAVGGVLWKATEDYRKTSGELTESIESNNTELQNAKKKLQELNDIKWYDRTPKINDEIQELKDYIEELKTANDKLDKIRQKKFKNELEDYSYDTGETTYTVNKDDSDFSGVFYSEASLLKAINEKAGTAYKSLQEVEAANYTIVEQLNEPIPTQNLYASYIDELSYLHDEMKDGNTLTEERQKRYAELKSILADYIAKVDDGTQSGYSWSEATKNNRNEAYLLLDAIDKTTAAMKAESQQSSITQEQIKELVDTCPELTKVLKETSTGYYSNVDALSELAKAEYDAAIQTGKSEEDALEAVRDATKQRIELRQQELRSIVQNLISQSKAARGLHGEETTESTNFLNQAKYVSGLYNELENRKLTLWSKAFAIRMTGITGSDEGDSGSSKSSTKSYTDEALKEFQSLQKDISHQLNIGELSQEEYYNKLEELVKQYKEKATAHMKEYGLTVNQINQNMYQYEEDIYSGRNKLLEELASKQKEEWERIKEEAEEARSAWEDALEQERSDYETAASYVVDKIQEEIDKLQELRDETAKYYEDKIQKLQDSNSELEKQIEYENLLKNLAEAKEKQLYVFQDGQFQYIQDVDAISAAQAELDAYERERILKQEVSNLEKLKEEALKNIDDQIEGWEKYKEEWSNVVSQYTDAQNKLIAEQVLGVDLEQKNWEKRLENAQSFANRYNAIMEQISTAQSLSNLSTVGGSDYVGGGSSISMSAADKAALAAAGVAYNKATSDAGREAAHKTAEAIRAKYGFSGGTAGDQNIPLYASGTLSAQGGLSLVGEKGPELRVLGQGDGILPTDVTRNLWNWGKINPNNIGGNTTHIFNIDNLTLPNVNDAKSLVAGLKNLAYQRAYKRA